MDQKPTEIWIIVLIVAVVGVYYLIEGLTFMPFGMVSLVLGVLTLLIAFLVYNGSRGGKTFLTVILILSIIGNLITLVALKWLEDWAAEQDLDVGGIFDNAYISSAIFLVLALVTFFLLYRPSVKAYFKD